MNTYIIGLGGIGIWAAQCLDRALPENENLFFVDGDHVSERNIDRQLFKRADVMKLKTEIVKQSFSWKRNEDCVISVPRYFNLNTELFEERSIVFSCVDNHPARSAVFDACDRTNSMLITCANETWDAESYVYFPAWKDTALDPRVYYPEIKMDTEGDPLRPSCTAQTLEDPQLSPTNLSAAAYGMWLFNYWILKGNAKTLSSASDASPVHILSNHTRTRTINLKEKTETQ